jgi:hypothetical protein
MVEMMAEMRSFTTVTTMPYQLSGMVSLSMENTTQRRKSQAGLADSEVRHGTGGQQHRTLSLLATALLVQEPERGKNGRQR